MARYPEAIWRPCSKHGYGAYDTHLHQGVVIHSAEGSAAGLLSVLDSDREASWHFHINKDGRVYQPVDTDNIAWTNGSREANQRFWGIENEGRAPEPLTEPQYQSLLALVKWLWATYNLGAPVRQDNFWEHREMTRFGAPPTSCPGDRIPWTRLIADMEDDMTPEEYRAIAREAADAAIARLLNKREQGSLARALGAGFLPDLAHAVSGAAVAGAPNAQPSAVMKAIRAAVPSVGTGLKRGDTVSVVGTVKVE